MERAGWGGVGGRGGEEGEEKTLGAQARQAMPTSALFRADADIGDEEKGNPRTRKTSDL